MKAKLIGAVVVAVLLLLGLFAIRDSLSWVPFLKPPAVVKAEAREKVATQQAELNGETVRIIDRTHIITQTVKETAHVEAGKVAADPAGSAVLDPGFRDRWASAVGRVREAGSSPANHGPGEPEGAVPAS